MGNRHGFTLIELLVVIAVIGLLSSIVLVNLRGTREDARIAAAEQFAASAHHSIGIDAVGVWDFIGNANDSSGYGNDGAVNGAVLAADRNGTASNAYSFDGLDDGIVVGSDGTLDNIFEGGGTIVAWLQIDSAGLDIASGRIADKDSSSNGWAWYVSDTGSGFGARFHQRYDSGATTANWGTDDNVLTTGWHHLAVSWDSSSPSNDAQFYLDGAPASTNENTAPGTSKDNDDSSTLHIGRDGSNQRNFHGRIDDVRIYSRALTAGEVQHLYVQDAWKYASHD